MARTISEIKKELTENFMLSDGVAKFYDLPAAGNGESKVLVFEDHFSKVSIESIFFYVTAFGIWTLEKLFDLHKKETEELLNNKHPHTLRWYAEKARKFMLGKEAALSIYNDEYDTSGMTEKEIQEARIITYAACQRRQENGRIILEVKVAKGKEELQPLDFDEVVPEGQEPQRPEMKAFESYMNQIKDAGVQLRCISRPADYIRQEWTVYYDPQILDQNGDRLDGTQKNVVEEAIRGYLKNLPFNGRYFLTSHIDAVQAVEGVKIPLLRSCEIKANKDAAFYPIEDKNGGVIADSGWFRFYKEKANVEPLTIIMKAMDVSYESLRNAEA